MTDHSGLLVYGKTQLEIKSLVDLRHLFDRLETPPAGQRLIEKARRAAPVRQVVSNSNNVITRFGGIGFELLATRNAGGWVVCSVYQTPESGRSFES